jgi:hypothetical protein
MDRQFSRRFRLPLKLYRRLRRAKDEYLKASSLITSELYDLTEWQGQGIAAQTLIRLLEEAGFKAKAEFHWYGLSALTDRLFGPRRFPRGWAPLVSVTARKAGDARR